LTREGFEVEAKTLPLFNTTLGLGYTYAHIYNTDTSVDIKGLPRHHLLLNANYRAHGTDATLFARYINWNGITSNDQVVWDFLLSQRVFAWQTGNANITFSARNIFNTNQQPSSTFPNPPLRIDAGFLVNF
jgi:vitamin B12 transporter